MDTTLNKKGWYSAMQNPHSICYLAPKKQVCGAHFDVVKILLTILQINQHNGMYNLLGLGESPPFKRKMEGFCKEKEKLFAYLWSSPPQHNTTEALKLRKNCTDFSGFVVLEPAAARRQIW